ncbi:hypothetical protein N431DRAFT_488695 [Stipitochalara longipes BDJ]|nr:hypothetical protein N431DRAFT_488695 [Stipitochalara longipes BDJ]
MARIRAYFSKRQQQNKIEHKHEPVSVRITARTPVPLDLGRPSLAQLPDDVVLLVLTFVEDSDLRSIASLSSALYEKARHVQHHTVHIDLSQCSQAQGRLDVLVRNLLLPTVRVLEVNSSNKTHQEGEETNEILAQLADILSSMTGLRDLHWHVPVLIPRPLLDHMPTRTRLHTSVAAMEEPHYQVRAFLAQLVDNQNLFSLSVHVAFVDEHVCRATMRALKQVLLSCPRLVRIPLLYVGPPVRPPHGIASWPKPGAPYCGLGLSGGERPPALEELGLAHYPWGNEPTAAVLAMSMAYYCIGYPEKGAEARYWAETFDWSRLRRLNDISSNLAMEMAPKLTALKEVDFQHRFSLGWDKAAFLEQIPTVLELVTIPSWREVSNKPDPIIRHGAALRKLTIHRVEPWTADRMSLLTDADLVALCNGLPHLTELTLDIARDKNENAWPYSSLEIIARFPCLRSVQLWFELGYGHPAPPTPHVTVSSTRQLFTFLRERNRNIQRLELCSGAPDELPWDGDRSWAKHNSIRLVCEVSLLDVDEADKFLRVTCPDFSTEMNAKLARLARETREGTRGVAEDAKRLLLEVALDGPLTVDEFNAWIDLTWARATEIVKSAILNEKLPPRDTNIAQLSAAVCKPQLTEIASTANLQRLQLFTFLLHRILGVRLEQGI